MRWRDSELHLELNDNLWTFCVMVHVNSHQHHCLADALVASKARLSEMHALEGLYCEARDELSRLDKENLELKDMWQQGVSELGQSGCVNA